MKVKTKQKGKIIEIDFLEKRKQVGYIVRYVNRCIVCKKPSIHEKDMGEKYICPECLEVIKNSTNIEVSKPKSTTTGTILKQASLEYTPSIEIVNLQEYYDLMVLKVTKEQMTMFTDLIIKGCNTIEKIAKATGGQNNRTIYTYLWGMSKVGMIYMDRKPSKPLHKQIWKVNPHLTYTLV